MEQDIPMRFPVGLVATTDPTGPDQYGYYMYDNTDVSNPLHPTFGWIELAPGLGGHGTRRVDTRIVVATNRSLLEMVEAGKFRADLYYRLSGVEVRVPPLRDRREDVAELALHLLDRHHRVRRLKVSESAVDALLAYDWPGNVRELERVMERAIALAQGDEIRLEDLPAAVAHGFEETLLPSLARDESLRTWGSRYARLMLQRYGNNKRQTCRVLGISYHTLRTYLRSPHHKKRPSPESTASASRGQAVESRRESSST